jgi:hypothetical protein
MHRRHVLWLLASFVVMPRLAFGHNMPVRDEIVIFDGWVLRSDDLTGLRPSAV